MMSDPARLAADRLAGFPPALRQAGLAIDPGRTATFLKAVAASPPGDIRALARIGRVTLTGSRQDLPIFDDVFDAWFGEAKVEGRVDDPEQDRAPRPSPRRDGAAALPPVQGDAAGHAAADDDLRGHKQFGRLAGEDRDVLARLARRFDRLPRRPTRRWRPDAAGPRIDLARTLRAARRSFGETLRLMRAKRPDMPRRLLLLVDVSGSMKATSETSLRFAHLTTAKVAKAETFCFGTRLTRVTRLLRHRDAGVALGRLSGIVHDFDGGTAIGASLEEFLSVSRYASLVRGAVVIVFSDGLERGDPGPMVHAVARLSRLSHRLLWATPLAADPGYRPATRAMRGALPHLDAICDGSGLPGLERLLDDLARCEAGARRGAWLRWRTQTGLNPT
jgi:hypothetical protein